MGVGRPALRADAPQQPRQLVALGRRQVAEERLEAGLVAVAMRFEQPGAVGAEGDQHSAAVVLVGATPDQALGLEPVDQPAHRRTADRQPRARSQGCIPSGDVAASSCRTVKALGDRPSRRNWRLCSPATRPAVRRSWVNSWVVGGQLCSC